MSWERGNLLKEYTNANATYFYNSQGIRFKKKVSEDITTYYLDGSKLLEEFLNNERSIKYNYNATGISGFQLTADFTNGAENKYFYVKDAMDNIILILDEERNEVAKYSYDAWGNCTILKNINGIGDINPIRWKSQYYDKESKLYYINGRYYSPDIKQYISAISPETAMANAGTIYGLNMYLLTVANPISKVYNRHTIATNIKLSWDPGEDLSGWERFWKSKFGKWTALGLMLLRLLIPGGIFAVGFTLAGLAIGGIFAGVRSMNQGKGFMHGFSNYINGEWAQAIAITAILVIVTFGISTIARAAVAKASSKTVLPNSVTETSYVKSRVFTSNDPYVADLANRIESLYPGHVVEVNKIIKGTDGLIKTDFDIVLQNSVIQVKSAGNGLARQIKTSSLYTDKVVIGYGPNLKTSIIRQCQNEGLLVTNDINILLDVIRP